MKLRTTAMKWVRQKKKPQLEIRFLETSLGAGGFTCFPEDGLMFERLLDDRCAGRCLLLKSLPVQDQEASEETAVAMKLSVHREFLDNKLC